MRKLILAAASVAFIAASGSAFAGQIEGTVASVDAAQGTLALQSGETVKFQNGAILNGILPGQTVGIAYQGNQALGVFNPHPANVDNIDHD